MNATQNCVQVCLYAEELRVMNEKTMLDVDLIFSIEKKWTSMSKLVNSMKLIGSVTGNVAVYVVSTNSIMCGDNEFCNIKVLNRYLKI